MKKLREWISIKTVKAPRLIVLLFVLAANIVFILATAFIISRLIPESMEESGFLESLFNTLMMYLGIGGIEMVIEEISGAGIALVLTCVVTIVIGMVVFMYSLIGYMSEVISSFIADADSSARKLRISGHIVILNWNSRAAEIINELLYKGTREKVVVLVSGNREDVTADIDERLSATIDEEGIKSKLDVIVREGDSWSIKQLNDISIKSAKSIIILCNEVTDGTAEQVERGNTLTIKTLLQVAQLVAEEDSANEQKIIVEVEDDWTLEMVNTIIRHKEQTGGDVIVPIAVNKVLGQIFSQFSIMPELNIVFSTLLSNKGAAFYSRPAASPSLTESEFVTKHLGSNHKSVPLTVLRSDDGKLRCYYMSDSEQNISDSASALRVESVQVTTNAEYEMTDKHVVVLGHNSKSSAIMEGFEAFSEEWSRKDGTSVLEVIVIDDEENLAKLDYYEKYPCVKKTVAADIYESSLICGMIGEFIDAHTGDGCIMILSDDTVSGNDVDADALTYLVHVQEIINARLMSDPGFSINMLVEILDPKNYDIVSNYSTNQIVISNRFISKIIMQIGEKDSLFDFYSDILSYDEPGSEETSKELYVKKASEFFSVIPEPCTAAELIRAVHQASPDDNKSIMLGYFSAGGEMVLFEGDQSGIHVSLSGEEKLILFSNH